MNGANPNIADAIVKVVLIGSESTIDFISDDNIVRF